MLRFILRRQMSDAYINLNDTSLHTVDIDVPELEALLRRGGFGGSGFDSTQLVGVELLPALKAPDA